MQMIRAAGVTAIILFSSAASVASADALSQCSDKNKLNSAAVDARLVAIEFYYRGFIDGLADGDRKSCYLALVLNSDELAIANKTLDLIERDCLPIARAARAAAEGLCP